MKKLIAPYTANIIVAFLALLFLFIFSSLFTYFYFSRDLKSKETIMNRNNTGLVLLDRNNKPFFTFYEGRYGEYTSLSDIPKKTQQAVIAAEDKEFYNHPGFSVSGIIRSAVRNTQENEVVAGGSTITQQLVKNAILTSQRNFLRKYQEIIIAQEIERRYSKDEILEMYLNSVYFGEGAFGIEQAAERYFNKSVSELTVAESALLAGILPAPSEYSPKNGSNVMSKKRQKYVLENMANQGYITQDEKEKALRQKLVFKYSPEEINKVAPHFALMVRDQLIKEFGEENIIRSGFRVKTTLNTTLQKTAENIVAKRVAALAPNNVSNGGAVIIDPKSGEILTMVGSKDWYNADFGKVNVTLTPRQPGSSFKPIVYALAMEEREITPATVLTDSPTTFAGNYKPQDYDRRYRGKVAARRALANSLNIPSVEVMSRVGIESVLDFAKRMGITTLKSTSNYGLSLVLGTGEVKLVELTNAYAVFANNGAYNEPTAILEIDDKVGNEIYHYKPKNEQILEPEVAFLISSILSDSKARAEVFGSVLNISRPAAVKTGTTENYRDALTVGFTPQVAVGVWVGNNDGEVMDEIAGSLGAAPIWKDLMEEALKSQPVLAFNPPTGVIQLSGCFSTSASSSAVRSEYFINGTQPNVRQTCYASTPRRIIIPEVNGADTKIEIPEPEVDQEKLKQEMEELKEQIREEVKKNRGRGNGNGKKESAIYYPIPFV